MPNNRSRVATALLPHALFIGLLFTASAHAGLTICNQTEEKRSIAIGYKGGDGWMSEGWWIAEPDQCVEVVSGELKQRYYYYRAITPKGSFKGAGYKFCTQKKSFTIHGDQDCEQRGHRREEFAKVDTGKTSKSFKLTLTGSSSGKASRSGSSNGNQLTINGRNKGCDRVDGTLWCTIEGDGEMFLAMDDGRTPAQFLEQLDGLAMNQTVRLTAQRLAQGDTRTEIAIHALEVPAAPRSQSLRQQQTLIGAWRSADDQKSVLRFTSDGGHYDYYNGDLLEQGGHEVTHACPNGVKTGGQILVTTTRGDPEKSCYTIVTLTEDRLVLSLVGGRGNDLTYFRLE